MQILAFSGLLRWSPIQARFRGAFGLDWGISELVKELVGLAGLLGWLGVLFYLISIGAAVR